MRSALRTGLALALLAGCAPDDRVPTGAHLQITAGDRQSALKGQGLPLGPSVLVTDAKGAPVAGVPVGWQVIAGGGSTGVAISHSGSDGVATCGAWKLGEKAQLNQLNAYANGIAPVTFSAIGFDQAPQFPFTLELPSNGIANSSLDVVVDARDSERLTNVLATYAGRSVNLIEQTFDGNRSVFAGTLDLSGVALGTVDVLMVRAVDDHIAVAEAGALLTFDEPPALVVTSPSQDASFSRPTGVQLAATATSSGDGDVVITASTHGRTLAQGTNILLATVDLSMFDQQVDEIVFTATDELGAQTTVSRFLWVSSNPHVQPAAQVAGQIIDYDGEHALHDTQEQLALANFSTGSDELLGLSGNTPAGLVAGTVIACPSISLGLANGVMVLPVTCGSQFHVAGDAVAFTDSAERPWLANLDANAVTMSWSAPVQGAISLAPTGDVVFNDTNYDVIHVSPNGMPAALPLDRSDGGYRVAPVTDGHLIAYLACGPSGCGSVGVWDGTEETLIAVSKAPALVLANSGWLAWVLIGSSGPPELWVEQWQKPAMRLGAQLSQLRPLALLSNGTVLAFDGSQQLWRLPVSGPPEAFFTQPFSSDAGTVPVNVLQRDGRAFILFGGLAVEVQP